MIRNEKMRDALKQVEATVTATLAHQPEDDEKCGQFLYDALVRVYNIADGVQHRGSGVSRGKRRERGGEMIGIACIGVAFVLLAALAAAVCGIIDDRRSDNPGKDNEDADDARK